MKTTKVIILASLALCLASGVQAQNGRLSVGAELGLPMGDFADANNIGFGGSLRYEHPMGDNLGLMLTAGYLTFGGKDGGPSWGLIPIQAGLKYYFQENQSGFYAGAEIGVHMLGSQTYQTIVGYDPVTLQPIMGDVKTDSQTKMSYAPELGYHLANLDLGLRYQIVATEGSTLSYLGLRIAYVFGEK